jgi:hypothetical protein
MTALIEKQIIDIVVFSIEIEKSSPSINEIMYSFMIPIILTSQ